MTERDLQRVLTQSVQDVRLSDEARRQIRLAAKEERPMRMKKFVAIALAMLMLLTTTAAMAAAMVTYSPEAAAKKLATQAMCDTYGFDRNTLGLFKMEVVKNGQQTLVYVQAQEFLPLERVGEYLVTIENGHALVTWTHDGKDISLWQTGDPDSPVWGAKQLVAYLNTAPGARDQWLAPYLPTAEPVAALASSTPMPPPAVYDVDTEPDTAPKPHELTLAQAQAYADAALVDMFGMSQAEVASLDHELDAYVLENAGCRFWNITYANNEAVYYVYLDAVTGEIIDIGISTGGNG